MSLFSAQLVDLRHLRANASVALPAFTFLAIGSGLYSLVPGIAYVLVMLGGAGLLLNTLFGSSPMVFVQRRSLTGFAIFNLFFLLHTLPHYNALQIYQTPRTLYLHVLSIGMFIFALAFGRLLLARPAQMDRVRSNQIFMVLAGIALSLLLIAQIAQVVPMVREEAQSWIDMLHILLRRPGGFFNPNMTAAIALIFLFVANETSARRTRALAVIVVLTVAVVLLSQSRIGMIVLFGYGFFLHARKTFLICVALAVAVLVAAVLVDAESVGRLLMKVARRFTGDSSSQLRLELTYRGLAAFWEAPLLGKGYRYVELTAGQSTHSEIIEILASYGIVGLSIIGLAGYLLYWGGSARFMLVCIAPTFLFSHNFFETVSFQAALGFAFAVDRNKGGPPAEGNRMAVEGGKQIRKW